MSPDELLTPSPKRRSVITIAPGSFGSQNGGRMSPEMLDMSTRRASIMAIAPVAFIPQVDPEQSSESLVAPAPKRTSVIAMSPGSESQHDALSSELLERSSKRGSIVAITPGRYRGFFEKSPEAAIARKVYLKVFISGSLLTILLIFGIFSIFWGSLWKIPDNTLSGIIVDLDGGIIGKNLTQFLTEQGTASFKWRVLPASQFPGGTSAVGEAILQEKAWIGITANAGSSSRLSASLSSPNSSYDGTTALTIFGVEGRNENAYRNIVSPVSKILLNQFATIIAKQTAQTAAAGMLPSQIAALLATSPQTLVQPVSFQLVNLAPFTPPVASAVTFVGLILELILAFFLVMMGAGARDASRLDRTLPTRSLITLRFVSTFASYFIVSLCFSLVSLAFKLPVSHKFGHSGFLVFWALNYIGMLSVGLALEAMVTLLTPKFIPFFMLVWIIVNVSVAIWPIDVLPRIFHYGYAVPFYNISRAMRTLVFGTKNRIGFEFGILFAWIALSCATLPLIQIFVRRKFQPVDVTALNVVQQPSWKQEDNTGSNTPRSQE